MMVKVKGWETPTIDSADLEPGNFYAFDEAILQGHQIPSVPTDKIYIHQQAIKIFKIK
jgi:hypothetical protein